ncbi:unnamed protein product [Ranitomeya imitator]|uniref:C3H1-type domain-containing protein n=1 Tax=Ranitomeya imitator TaxID=111125 RepID=A0ABN9L7E3_9NEOB|nr:unnamed protein product [Ranitomeya imitator]
MYAPNTHTVAPNTKTAAINYAPPTPPCSQTQIADSFLSVPALLRSPCGASLIVATPSPALSPGPPLTPHGQGNVPPTPEVNAPNTSPRQGDHRHRCRRSSSPSSVDSHHRSRCPSSCRHSHSSRRHHSHRSRRNHHRSRSSRWRSPSTTGSDTSGSYNGRYRSHAERRRSHRTPRAGTRWEQTLTPPVTDQAEIRAPIASHPRAHNRSHPSRAPSWADAQGDTPYVPPRSTSQHRTSKTIEAGAPPAPGDARHQTQGSRIHPRATTLAAGLPSSSSCAGGQHQDSATAGARVPPSGDTRPASDNGEFFDVGEHSTIQNMGESELAAAIKTLVQQLTRPGVPTDTSTTQAASLHKDAFFCGVSPLGAHVDLETTYHSTAAGQNTVVARGPGACLLFNDGYCRFQGSCKYRHECSSCGGGHPASRCTRQANRAPARFNPSERNRNGPMAKPLSQ